MENSDVEPTRRGGRRLFLPVLLAIGLPVLLLAGCATVIATALAAYLEPTPGIGFVVGDGTCVIDADTGNALVELPMTAAQSWTEDLQVKPVSTPGLTIAGVATLAPGDTLRTLNESSARQLRAALDENDMWARADAAPTNVVVEFHKEPSDETAELDAVKIWWTSGEPAYVQEVDLNLIWSASNCSVST